MRLMADEILHMKIQTPLLITAAAAIMLGSCGKPASSEASGNAEADDKTTETIASLRKENDRLKAELNKRPRVEVVSASVAVKGVVTDANDLIMKLADESTTGADTESQKRVVHYFESLVDGGNDSVAAIDSFLDKDMDRTFGRKSFRQELGITNDQITQLREIGTKMFEERGQKMREIMGNRELSWDQRREQMRALWEGSESSLLEVMTDEQRAKIEEMGGDVGRNIRMLIGGGDRRRGGDRGRGPGGR